MHDILGPSDEAKGTLFLGIVEDDGVLGATTDGRIGRLLALARYLSTAQDLAKTTFVVYEQCRGDHIATAMAGAALRFDREPQGVTVAVKTSGSSRRCNVPEGHTTSGSACAASS